MESSSSTKVFNPDVREGMTSSDIADMFSKAASYYERGWEERGYAVYKNVAEATANYFTQKSTVRILDVAAGTGLVAMELWSRGFRHIDGLDPAEGMREEAKKKNIYTQYFLQFMNGGETPGLITDSYDGVVSCASFNNGLLPCDAVIEMVRVTKPGGLICFITYDSVFSEVEEYKGRLWPLMQAMVDDGFWQLLDTSTVYEHKPQTLYRYIVNTSQIPEGKYQNILMNKNE